MADIPYQKDGVVNDLLGAENTLQLLGSFLINEVLIQVKPGGSQKRARIVMEICCYSLALFFLETDGGIQVDLLLLRLKFLHLDMILDHFPLVHDNKDNDPYR
jgi:hypothetical protein